MNKTLEIILFIILFILIIYLYLAFMGLYQLMEEEISNSELKMNDKLMELKNFLPKNNKREL